ncbi:unnamed protein product [Pleuronectes platessa]|uniref:Uncharacterized protein n=1 Tax=Pleuronectes platessa TaxID=8262 RepID=A0A9N7YXQ9_PLEPL|nr:unnamed protein product [Pleuronectes platessa]
MDLLVAQSKDSLRELHTIYEPIGCRLTSQLLQPPLFRLTQISSSVQGHSVVLTPPPPLLLVSLLGLCQAPSIDSAPPACVSPPPVTTVEQADMDLSQDKAKHKSCKRQQILKTEPVGGSEPWHRTSTQKRPLPNRESYEVDTVSVLLLSLGKAGSGPRRRKEKERGKEEPALENMARSKIRFTAEVQGDAVFGPSPFVRCHEAAGL